MLQLNKFLILLLIMVCMIGISSAMPVLTFIGDTPADEAKIHTDHCTIELGITESDLDVFQFNYQGTYYPMYNDNLVFCMPLNNIGAIGETGTTAIDVSEYGNDGISVNIDWSTSGRFEGAVNFDGADIITVPSSNSLNVTQTTLEAWVYPALLGIQSSIMDKEVYSLKITPDNNVYFGGRGDCDPYTWSEVKSSPIIGRYVQSLSEFNGYLYAGTGSGGVIFRSPTGSLGSWVEVTDLPDYYSYGLQEYNGSLYLNTGNAGKIYNTTDGLTWNLAYDSPEYYMYSIGTFDDYLYVGSGSHGKLYRYSDSTGWAEIHDFLNAEASYIRTLCDFDGYLYAGTGGYGKIFRSNDGTTWNEVHDNTDQYIYSLCEFNGSIYAGTGTGAKILRSPSGDSGTWTEVVDLTDAAIYTLTEFNGSIFAGVSNSGKIYMSPTGNSGSWVEILNTDESYVYCFEDFNGCLYSGMAAGGKVFKMANGFDLYSTATIGASEYTHVTGTYDGTTANIYINGMLDNSVSELGIGQSDDDLIIGESFQGRIDEVRIHDTVLTPAQIGFNYNASIYQTNTDIYNYTVDLTSMNWGCHDYFGMAENTSSEQGVSETRRVCVCFDTGDLNITDVETYSLSDETVRIKWETSRITNNVVYYSLDENDINPTIGANASISEWNNGTMSPRIQLFNLIPSKNYFYKVYSVDQCDNNATGLINDFYTTVGTNRMPVIIYLACCILVFVLIGATVVLRTNEEYLDVLAGFLAIFTAFMVAQLSISQKVYTAYSEITTDNETIMVYDTFNSISVHYLFMLVAVLMVLYVSFLIIEILIFTYKNIIDRRYNDL